MDFNSISSKDMQTMDLRKLSDSVIAVRKELVTMRMDVYNAGPQANSKARKLRKTLARFLMVSGDKSRATLAKMKK